MIMESNDFEYKLEQALKSPPANRLEKGFVSQLMHRIEESELHERKRKRLFIWLINGSFVAIAVILIIVLVGLHALEPLLNEWPWISVAAGVIAFWSYLEKKWLRYNRKWANS